MEEESLLADLHQVIVVVVVAEEVQDSVLGVQGHLQFLAVEVVGEEADLLLQGLE